MDSRPGELKSDGRAEGELSCRTGVLAICPETTTRQSHAAPTPMRRGRVAMRREGSFWRNGCSTKRQLKADRAADAATNIQRSVSVISSGPNSRKNTIIGQCQR